MDDEADTITEAPTEPVRAVEPAAEPEPPAAAIEPETPEAEPAEARSDLTPTPVSTPIVEVPPEPEMPPAVDEASTEEIAPVSVAAPALDVVPAGDESPTEEIAPVQPPSEPAPPEEIPVAPALPRAAAPDAALLDREIKPVGPSIWEVFGIAPPNGEQPPAVDTATDAAAEAPIEPSTQALEAAAPAHRRSPRRTLALRVRAFERAQGLRLRLNQEQARRLHHRIKKTGS